jgi:signal transduction histidine kinase
MTKGPESKPGDSTAIRNYPRLSLRYARLLELTTDLVSTLDLESLLNRIVEAAQELTESEAASLLLHDPETNNLYFEAATSSLVEGLGRPAIPTENSIAGWIFSHGEPLIVDDVLRDPRFFREVDVLTRFQTRSVLGVPLRTKKRTLGVIEAVNKGHGGFNEEDRRLLQTLAAQAAIAIENSRLFQQSDIIAEMVHELRTPLASLSAAAYLLQRPDLPEDQRHKLGKTVYAEVRRLNGLASDFLDLSHLESGRAKLTREPVHLGGLVQECLEIIHPLADEEQIHLETDIDRELSPVQGDRNRLKQVLLNLLTNAIKYNDPGGKVIVGLHKQEDDVVLRVSDSGRGIPPESLPHIFQRFYRVPAHERQEVGSGLGLAIAKRIVESHQGKIEIESTVGTGSTFTVRLPSGSETRPPTLSTA